MSKRARRRAIAAGASAPYLLASLLVACGGSSIRHEPEGGEGTEVGGTAGVGAVGGTGTAGGTGGGSAGTVSNGGNTGVGGAAGIGGTAAVGGTAGVGTAGSAGTCIETCTDRMLDDFETGSSGANLQIAGKNAIANDCRVLSDPPRGGSLLACHLSDDAELGGANLGYHQHMIPFWTFSATEYDKPYAGIRLWARRGSPGGTSSLVVAVTGLERELGDYQADLEAGNPWLAHRFPLTDEWQEYSALFIDFAAEGPGDAESTWDSGGQVLHFIVPEGEPLDVWIDDIELVCAPSACQ